MSTFEAGEWSSTPKDLFSTMTYKVEKESPNNILQYGISTISISHAFLEGLQRKLKVTSILVGNFDAIKDTRIGARIEETDFYEQEDSPHVLGLKETIFSEGLHELFYRGEKVLKQSPPSLSMIVKNYQTNEFETHIEDFRFNQMPEKVPSFIIRIKGDGSIEIAAGGKSDHRESFPKKDLNRTPSAYSNNKVKKSSITNLSALQQALNNIPTDVEA